MNDTKRSTTFSIITTLITKFILLFGGFIISILLARLLGPEGKGIITAIFVFPLLIISLADMGIRQSTAYFIGKNKHKLSDIISSVAFLWVLTSIISVFIVFIYYLLGPSNQYSWIVLLVAMCSVPLKLIEQYAKGVMLGQDQISTINLSQLLRLITNFIFVIMLVWLFDLGILGAAIVQVLMAFVVAIYYLYKIMKVDKVKFKPVGEIPKLLFFRGFSFALALFIINLNYKIDIMILDVLVTPKEIGLYSVGVNFAELMLEIPSAVGMVLFAKSTTSKNQFTSIQRATSILRTVMPLMLLSSIAIAVMAPMVIRLLYGEDFAEAGNYLRILLPGILFITISKTLHPELSGRGFPLFALRIFIITLILNVILNFILIPEYGAYGAAYASSISYIIAGLGFAVIYSKKEKINLRDILLLKKEDVNYLYSMVKKKLNKK